MGVGPLGEIKAGALFSDLALPHRGLMFGNDISAPGGESGGSDRDRNDDIGIHSGRGQRDAHGEGGCSTEEGGIFARREVFASRGNHGHANCHGRQF